MDIKRAIKFGFIAIMILMFIISALNVIAVEQLKENSREKEIISKMVFYQNRMDNLLKRLFETKNSRELNEILKIFTKYESKFEDLKDKIKNNMNSPVESLLIGDISKNRLIANKLKLLYENEMKIEKVFANAFVLHRKKLSFDEEINKKLPEEKRYRYAILNSAKKSKNLDLISSVNDIKYYSKEMIYQYRDKKHLKLWLKSIEDVERDINSTELNKYKKTAMKIGECSISIENIYKQEKELMIKVNSLIQNSQQILKDIEINVEKISSEYKNSIYRFILILLLAGILFITVLSYFVYRNVGISVDHINKKIEEGLSEIKRLNKEIEDTQREVVFTMGAIGERRSKETGNHVKRVAEYSKILALAYGLPQKEAELLKEASPMHDIGKVAIPDNILNKPGRLTPEEFEVMKQHATLGYEMMKHSKRDILKTASIIAYEHHEKWDGSGYPRGLKGEDINIHGRITAIADVFDALGSDRVYKKAWEDEKIFNFFKEQRGKHFDPKLVDLFFANLDEFLKIREKFRDIYSPQPKTS